MGMRTYSQALIVALSCALISVPSAHAGISLDPSRVPPRTQINLRYSNGHVVETRNAHESRPAMSLAKLYLGMWVLQHGAPEDQGRVENMIRHSEDGTASYLDRKYPRAIPETIARYQLRETHYPGYWGNTTTSTNDVTRFTEAIVHDPVAAPIVRGMRTAAPVAADGYKQDYGTSRIPGVIGTKFGWADNRAINASASFGDGYSIAANTYGGPGQLTQDVLGAVKVEAPRLPMPPAPQPAGPSALERQILSVLPAWMHDAVRPLIRQWESWLKAVASATNSGSGRMPV